MNINIPRPDTGDPDSQLGHVPALDGVRGLAIIAILIQHLFPSNNHSPHWVLQALLVLRNQLWCGVQLFFALSGFLITGILFDTLNTPNYFRNFFGRRCLRIFPLYYGVLGVLLLLTPVFHFHWQGQAYRLLTYTPAIPFRSDWSQNPSPYIALTHFWSLAVEEQFYLFWPFLIFWLRTGRRILIATIVGAGFALIVRTSVALAGLWPINHTLPACLDSLMLGCSLAVLVRSRYRNRVLRWATPVFLLSAALAIFQALTHNNYSWRNSFYLTTIGLTIISLASASLIAACLKNGSAAQSIFKGRVLRFFGRYSYGLYVFHFSAYVTADHLLTPVLSAHGFSAPKVRLAVGMVALVVSVVVALLSYHLYEKHFLRLKRYFPYRREASVEAAPSEKRQVAHS